MPGVSGSMLAISLNVYEKLLAIIADIKNITFPKFKFLFSIILGAMISITLFSRGVKWLLGSFYFPIMLLFIGLILGGLPDITNEIKTKKANIKNILIFIFALTLSYTLTILDTVNVAGSKNIFSYFILGLIEAFSSIVPGISGTAIYMSLGVYDMILEFFSNIFNPIYFKFSIFFSLGILTGVFILAKTITYLLKNKKVSTYYAILGFMTSSIIVMFKEAFITIISNHISINNILEIILGLFFLYLGYKITIKINNLLTIS